MKIGIGERVIVNELADLSLPYDHVGDIGFITDIDRELAPFSYLVDFGNGEVEAFTNYELDKL